MADQKEEIKKVADELGIEIASLDFDNGWKLTTKDAHIFFGSDADGLIDMMQRRMVSIKSRRMQYDSDRATENLG